VRMVWISAIKVENIGFRGPHRDTCSIEGIVSENNIEYCITHWSGPPVVVLMTITTAIM
jgi:hypothetical protein